MRSRRVRSLCFLLAASLVATGVLAVEPAGAAPGTVKSAKAAKKEPTKEAKSDGKYRAYAQYEKDAAAYWQSVVDQRRVRIAKRERGEPIALTDYVLTQPPLWHGALPRLPLPIARQTRSGVAGISM